MADQLAVFCDLENVAMGAEESGYGTFDIDMVMQRVLDKGTVLVRKAYANWARFRGPRRKMHEAGFELLEVPSASVSGKNSADIRLVVDALDLCHIKPHLDGFVVISGDSDFSPLVSKLRENGKTVIGIGVRKSTSALLVAQCDEFLFYDDLVRKSRAIDDGGDPDRALHWVASTANALLEDRGKPVHGSMVKQVLRRKRPDFDEGHHGYKHFSALLEDAREHDLLELRADKKAGGYIVTGAEPAQAK